MQGIYLSGAGAHPLAGDLVPGYAVTQEIENPLRLLCPDRFSENTHREVSGDILPQSARRCFTGALAGGGCSGAIYQEQLRPDQRELLAWMSTVRTG